MTTVAKLVDGKLKIAGEITEREELATPTFTRTSDAYKQDGSIVNAGVPRIERIGKNLFNKVTVTNKSIVSDDDGSIHSHSGLQAMNASDYIAVTANTQYAIKLPTSGRRWGAFYDSSKTFIRGYAYSSTTFTTPANACYFRFSVNDADLDICQLELGSTATAYEPYQEGVLIEGGMVNLFGSAAMNVANWGTRNNSVISNDVSVEYIDGVSSVKVVMPGLQLGEGAVSPVVIVTPSTVYTQTFWLKGSGRIQIEFTQRNASNVNIGEQNLILDLTSEWKPYKITQTFLSSATMTTTYIFGRDSIQATTFYVGAIQLEAKPYATSFHPTTRSPESLTIPATALSAQEGTIEFDCYITVSTLQPIDSKYIFYCKGSSNANRFDMVLYGTTATIHMYNSDGVVKQATFPLSLLQIGKNSVKVRYNVSKIDCYINGVFACIIQNPNFWSLVPAQLYVGSAGNYYQSNAYFSNLRISSVARSDAELANAGALTVDEYTTYFAPLNSYPLELNQGHFTITSTGNIPHCEVVERPCIPDDVYYYPLTFDGKDSTHNFSPSEATNLVYSRDGVWVGTATQNYYTGYAPFTGNGGSIVDVSNTEGEFGFLASIGAKTWKCIKDGTGTQWHGWKGAYDNWITGVAGNYFTSSCYYKTANNAAEAGFHDFLGKSTDWLTTVGDNQGALDIGSWTPIEDDKWNLYSRTCLLNQAYTGAIGYDVSSWGYSPRAGLLYFHANMWEKKPFPSPFCATTRGAGSLEYNFNSSLGLDWNGDWTICYWKKPMGTHDDTMTGYSIESLGCGSNSVGGGYLFFGKESGYDKLCAPGVVATFDSYFNKWHMISLTKSGTSVVVKFWGIDGTNITKTFNIGTVASNYFVTQYNYDFMFGWNNTTICNTYYKDLVVAKRALTDAELFSIYNTQMKGYNSSGVLLIRDEISEGDLL